MRVGEQAKVVALDRPVPTKEDRSRFEGEVGLIVRRLNVPWTPETGSLWEVRFESGDIVVFSESELATVRGDRVIPNDMQELHEVWGVARRGPSIPFRRLGAGANAAPAVLALLVFMLAGALLVWAGISEESWVLGAAGALLVLIGIGAAGVLIS